MKQTGKLKIKKILKTILIVGLAIGVLGFGAATFVAVGYIMDAPPCDLEKLSTVETSYLYDSKGFEVAKLHDEQNRVIVSLDIIPEHVQKAFIAAEDERFEKHFGFDVIGMLRAAFIIIKEGNISQGGSTITQQLARGAYLSNAVKMERKVQEIWLAIQLERHLSKDEILEYYLNRIPFGNHAHGVEAAAQTYFNKSISEVNIAEAAMLAGIINAPSYSNPLDNESEAMAKRNSVLNNMLRLKFINEEQYREALNAEMVYGEPPSIEFPHPYYVDYVVHYELIRILTSTLFADLDWYEARDEAYDMIYKGGLKVYTSLDLPLQTCVEDTLNNDELYPRTLYIDKEKAREAIAQLPPDDEKEVNLSYSQLLECVDEENGVPQPQAAIVVADPATGEIHALGGGREYNENNKLLRYTSMRQPGSAIKPLVTYSPAFEKGILAGAGSTLDDSPFVLGK